MAFNLVWWSQEIFVNLHNNDFLWACMIYVLFKYKGLEIHNWTIWLSSDAIFVLIFGPFLTQLHSISLPPLSPYDYLSYVFPPLCLIHAHEQTTRTHLIVQLVTKTQSTWLPTFWNSPVPLRPPDPVLELPWLPSLVPTVQSSRLPGHGAQVGVCPLHKDLGWSQGSSSVPQQDLPDQLPPFNELCPLIL